MNIVFIHIPKTQGKVFEKNFHSRRYTIGKSIGGIMSVGHSWGYPTKIKGWLDWDSPNQKQGIYREVTRFQISKEDKIATIVRNPFTLLIKYFKDDWAWCRRYHDIKDSGNFIEDFQKFVDIYLDDSIQFHAPAFKKSLFSQLKDENGNWIIDEDSYVLRYEQLKKDLELFGKMTNVPLQDLSKLEIDDFNIEEYYTSSQISKLKKIWEDDLDYLGYLSELPKVEVVKKSNNDTKLKVALCFSGNIRDIEHTKDFWLNLIDRYNIDVYASFWNDENPKNGDTISNFKKIYNTKELEIEDYSNFKKSTLDIITPMIDAPKGLFSNLINYANEFHTLSMWYKIWKSNMLSKSLDIDYDIVIRARTDSYLEGDFEILKNEHLNIPVGRVYTDFWENSEGINDIFGYAKPKIMDYYSSTFLSLIHYVRMDHYMIPPEHLLRVHMHQANLSLRFFPIKLIVTRKSKNRNDEFYNKNAVMKEQIVSSDFIDITPNKDITWTKPIKDSVKF